MRKKTEGISCIIQDENGDLVDVGVATTYEPKDFGITLRDGELTIWSDLHENETGEKFLPTLPPETVEDIELRLRWDPTVTGDVDGRFTADGNRGTIEHWPPGKRKFDRRVSIRTTRETKH
jgi:hypothetical protein